MGLPIYGTKPQSHGDIMGLLDYLDGIVANHLSDLSFLGFGHGRQSPSVAWLRGGKPMVANIC